MAGFGAAAEAARRGLPNWSSRANGATKPRAGWWRRPASPSWARRRQRLPQTLCFAAPGFGAERQLMALDLEDVMVGAGSACSSGKVTPSHVLTAMGLDGLAGSALRVSGGWNTTRADWVRFTDVWLDVHARWKARQAAA
jgi:cysteine desulfurase